MLDIDDFRFTSHHLLLELDAATNHLMMLVVAKEVSGLRWDAAAQRQKLAYDAWATLLYQPAEDPMHCLDGRPLGSNGSMTEA
ncbi:hypothetical protein [Pseudomonas frederiksbergensis]|jgi:hypothetical protein|uniref:hypothetical protein n=1 Tax=Pseudomonas frederiksbergensis TaxID=104087 RepID=UPI003D263B9A